MQVTLNTRISPELMNRLDQESEKSRRPKSQIVAEGIQLYLEHAVSLQKLCDTANELCARCKDDCEACPMDRLLEVFHLVKVGKVWRK
ncbi:MAG: ribbon-helix-helix domain-containing protein [Dehalococcoidia bacterium]|jgi:predicted DNA-binding protein